jgi:hypothetical protein
VIEARRLPVIDVVTGLARGGEARAAMVYRTSLLVLLLVATEALGAEANVDAGGGSAMAGVARNSGMRAQQGEPVAVILHGLGSHAPSLDRVAILALRAELPPVEIRMAGGALRSCLGKNFRDVARITGYVLMHPAQREGCFLIVIKLRLCAERGPARGGVTILTGQREAAVRIPRFLRAQVRAGSGSKHQPEQHPRRAIANGPPTSHCRYTDSLSARLALNGFRF